MGTEKCHFRYICSPQVLLSGVRKLLIALWMFAVCLWSRYQVDQASPEKWRVSKDE